MSGFNDCSSGIRGYLEALGLAKARTRLADVLSGGGVAQNLPQSVGTPIRWNPASRLTLPEDAPVQPQPALMDTSLGEFEVNMVEALVGWKRWKMDNRLLLSTNGTYWLAEKPVQAVCNCNLAYQSLGGHWQHTCGIYSADEAFEIEGYGPVLGQIYGWGRYIRGNKGWRAQFAYPKCFYLQKNQANLIDVLKKYRVPIFIDEPLQIYDPREDGFEVPEIGG